MDVVFRQGCVQAVGPDIDALCWLDIDGLKKIGVSAEMLKARKLRDNCDACDDISELHVTLVSKRELKTLSREQGDLLIARFRKYCCSDPGIVATGVGGASDGVNKTRFMVLVWPTANQARLSFGLERKDFHLTLGFQGKDVHECPKSFSSLLDVADNQLKVTSISAMLQAASDHCPDAMDKIAIYKAIVHHYNLSNHSCAIFKRAASRALVELAVLCGRQSRHAESFQFAQEACNLVETPRARLVLGDILCKQGEKRNALDSYHRGVALCCEPQHWAIRTRTLQRISKLKTDTVQPVPGKFPRTAHFLNLGAATRDDLLLCKEKWAPFLQQSGNVVSIEEKIDGANLGIWCDENWKLVTKNRSHFVCSDTAAQWTGLDAWLDRHRIQLCDILAQRFVLYGEWMYARHSVDYDALPGVFVAFDIYDRSAERFLSVSSRDAIMRGCGIPVVANVGKGPFLDEKALEAKIRHLVANQTSKYRSSGTMEGVVVRCDEPREPGHDESTLTFQLGRGKLVRADFVHGIEQHWTRSALVRNGVKTELFLQDLKIGAGSDSRTVPSKSAIGVKYPSTPHVPFSPSVHADDFVGADFSAICGSLGGRVIVTEKLDGGNCCLRDGKVFGRTHSHEATHWSFGSVKQLYMTLLMTHYEVFESKYPGLELYGENMTAIHSIDYDRLCSSFYLFGAACRKKDGTREWFSWDEVSELAATLEIPTVPLVFDGRFQTMEQLAQLLKAEAAQNSRVSSEIAGEGFVVRAARRFDDAEFERCIFKYVRENHVQTTPDWKKKCSKARITLGSAAEAQQLCRPPVSSQPIQLFVDLDGTLADFEKRVLEITGKMPNAMPCSKMWRAIEDSRDFFGTLEWMPGAKDMWNTYLKPLNPTILSGVPDSDSRWAHKQKLAWCVRNLGPDVPVVLCATRDKNKYSGPGSVLIDDRERTRRPWEEKGGIFVHHTAPEDSVRQLEHILGSHNQGTEGAQGSNDNREPEAEAAGSGSPKATGKKRKSKKQATARKPRNPKFRLICLVGFPASGKSTFAQALCRRFNCTHVCQDDLGSRGACEDMVGRKIKSGAVVVDRCNVTVDERKRWLALSMVDQKASCIIHFRSTSNDCASRVIERTGHKTISTTNKASALKIVSSFEKRLQVPDAAFEGYAKLFNVDSFEEANELLDKL